MKYTESTVFELTVLENLRISLSTDFACQYYYAQTFRLTIPNYKVIRPAQVQRIIVKGSVSSIRPFVVGAVLRNVTIDADAYASFIDLQDKLHQNICRKRTLVAIGTHDLDTVQGS